MTPPIIRPVLFSLLIVAALPCRAQREITYSLGIFGGITSTFTYDEGISRDIRYQPKYAADFVPIGVHAGVDLNGFGFMIDPQVSQVGQTFNILNSQGGQVGERAVNLTYIQLPFSFKKHIIDLSFFKVSWVAGVSYAYLLSADETISHSDAKLIFPAAVYPILPAAYEVEYDGVVSPSIRGLKTLQKSDFKSTQLFGSFGFRSDWDVTDHARLSFDFRGNVGVFDPRTSAYQDRANNHLTIYEIGGKRRDFYASLTLGYARYLFIEEKAKAKKVKPFVSYGPKRKKPK